MNIKFEPGEVVHVRTYDKFGIIIRYFSEFVNTALEVQEQWYFYEILLENEKVVNILATNSMDLIATFCKRRQDFYGLQNIYPEKE